VVTSHRQLVFISISSFTHLTAVVIYNYNTWHGCHSSRVKNVSHGGSTGVRKRTVCGICGIFGPPSGSACSFQKVAYATRPYSAQVFNTPPTLGKQRSRGLGCLQARTTVATKCLHKVSVAPYNLLGNTAHRHSPRMSLSFSLSFMAMLTPPSARKLLWGACKLGQVAVYCCAGRQALFLRRRLACPHPTPRPETPLRGADNHDGTHTCLWYRSQEIYCFPSR
jgi:hypothetical protein